MSSYRNSCCFMFPLRVHKSVFTQKSLFTLYPEYQPKSQEMLIWWSLLHKSKRRSNHRCEEWNFGQGTLLRVCEGTVDVRIGLNLLDLENERLILHLRNTNVHSICIRIWLCRREDLLSVQFVHQRVSSLLKWQWLVLMLISFTF
jgi:hypothetical protein